MSEEKGLVTKKDSKTEAIENVAKLVKDLVGNRSIRKTAEDSGVAASYITGIINLKYLPSADILRKLTEASAKPQKGVTLEDLMVAAGYQKDYVKEAARDFVAELGNSEAGLDIVVNIGNSDVLLETHSNDEENRNARLRAYSEWLSSREAADERHRRFRENSDRFSSIASATIFKTLAQKRIPFSTSNERVLARKYKPDMRVFLSQEKISEWWFTFKSIPNEDRLDDRRLDSSLENNLSRLLFVEPRNDRKVSLVVEDSRLYDTAITYKDKLSYRGDLSIILIDSQTLSVKEETYLSHYEVNDGRATEIYLS